MKIYCDTVIVVYHLDHVGSFKHRVTSYLQGMAQRGDTIAISDLVRLEYRVLPLKRNDAPTLNSFEIFCNLPDVQFTHIDRRVFDRAAEIRAEYGFKLGDAIHLAAAQVGGCDRFLTNDHRLSRFTALPIEVLP